MINLKYSAAFLLLGASFASANATLPASDIPSYLGLDYMATEAPLNEVGCISNLGCGGQFTATFQSVSDPGGVPVGLTSLPANIFCVDSQEDFSPPQPGLALVESVASIDANASSVRYAASPTDWSNPLNTADPQVRYEMAAYLVSQYVGFSGSAIAADTNSQALGTTTGNSTNDDIQEAIWAITSSNALAAGVNYVDDPNVHPWVLDAEAHYTSLQGDWAVVSWNASADGTLDQIGSGGNAQTFIVQLAGGQSTITDETPTPEPGFYGALAVGLSGLFFAIRRRARA